MDKSSSLLSDNINYDDDPTFIMLKSVLDNAAFDAGFIIVTTDGINSNAVSTLQQQGSGSGSGIVLYANEYAYDLFVDDTNINIEDIDIDNDNDTDEGGDTEGIDDDEDPNKTHPSKLLLPTSSTSSSKLLLQNKNINKFISFWSPNLSLGGGSAAAEGGGGGLGLDGSYRSFSNRSYSNTSLDDYYIGQDPSNSNSHTTPNATNTSVASNSSSIGGTGTGTGGGSKSKSKKKDHRRQQPISPTDDQLSWNQVIQIASSSSSPSSDNNHQMMIRKWKITGTKINNNKDSSCEELEQQQQQKTQPPLKFDESTRTTQIKNTVATKTTTTTTTFPGVLELTPFPSSSTKGDNKGTILYWLVYVRHADYDDVVSMSSRSVSRSGSNSLTSQQQQRRTIRRSGGGTAGTGGGTTDAAAAAAAAATATATATSSSSRRDDSSPRITVDPETWKIVDVSNPNTNTNFDWIQKSLIGDHIMDAKKKRSNVDQQQQGGQPPDGAEQQKQPAKTTTTTTTAKLDFLVGNRLDASSSSGIALHNVKDYNTAFTTTGNVILEENITEAAFEAALDAIFLINEHGIINMVNTAATTLFGYTQSEFVGSNISMICGGGHQPYHESYMARYLATGDTRVIGKNRQLPAKRKDGTEFEIELGVVEVDTFAGEVRLFCGFVKDLTDLKAKEKLAQEIVDIANDPMFQIDEDATILMVNKAAERTFGYDREELIGSNISIICGGAHAKNHNFYINQYLRTGDAKLIGKGSYRELPARHKSGTEFPVHVGVVEIQSSPTNGKRTFCGFIYDLSRQKRSNDIMRGTIDTSLNPVLHANENGIIKMVNKATIEHLGYSNENELIGENVSIIVGGDVHAANHGQYIDRYMKTGEKRAMGKKRQLKAKRKDGSEIPIILGLSEIEILGGTERMFVAFLNIL